MTAFTSDTSLIRAVLLPTARFICVCNAVRNPFEGSRRQVELDALRMLGELHEVGLVAVPV